MNRLLKFIEVHFVLWTITLTIWVVGSFVLWTPLIWDSIVWRVIEVIIFVLATIIMLTYKIDGKKIFTNILDWFTEEIDDDGNVVSR